MSRQWLPHLIGASGQPVPLPLPHFLHLSLSAFSFYCQFGVGSPGGVEPVVHGIQAAFVDCTDEDDVGLASLDFRKAFNTVDRGCLQAGVQQWMPQLGGLVRLLYRDPSPLFLRSSLGGSHILLSQTGVRQGHPLAHLLFSLAIRRILEQLLGTTGISLAHC